VKKLLISFIFLTINSFGQFKILTDPTYEPKLRSSIELIKETDAGYYCLLNDYCSQIRITSDSIPNQFQDGIIIVPLRLVSSPSLNNLSCWLVYQSYMLRITEVGKTLTYVEKTKLAHQYESNFRIKLPKEYGNSLRERMKKFFDMLRNDPYENISETEILSN
jgi:hypothetical protein